MPRRPEDYQLQSNLKIQKGARVDVIEDGFWMEQNIQGHYADINGTEEREVLEELKKEPWEEVVARRFSEKHPWLYSIITDRGRSLFLDFLPLKKNGNFLDVGSGWGQIAIPLSRHGTVYCLDVTISRLKILQEIARQEKSTLKFVCGNFTSFPFDEGQFDAVIFNGALEWLALGNASRSIWQTQQDALRKTFNMLVPGGYLYVGIENALGLKYLFGAPDDHTCQANLSFLSEDRARSLYARTRQNKPLPAKTWSLVEYGELLTNAGLEVVQIYGCFPDYKLIRQMIPLKDVNTVLAATGQPYPEHSGIDGSTLLTNESMDAAYRLLAKNKIAEYFCPSFGIIAKKPA